MNLRGLRVGMLGVLVLTAGLLPGPATGGSEPAEPASRDPVAGCRVFPAHNYWNTRVDDVPVHPRSDQWLRHMSLSSRLHPDFGPSYGELPVPYGIPITVVGGDHPRGHVRFVYASESDRVR